MQTLEFSEKSVFLNIPYDDRFRRLYLAYITGLIHLGLRPRATIEIPGGQNRLDKIIDLIRSCRYSIHDLSRVQLDRTPPRTPHFNMPFELGLAVASAKLDSAPHLPNSVARAWYGPGPEPTHDWFVFETVHRRLSKSLSDLSGIDPNIHHGTVEGVMRELCNAFVRQSRGERASVQQMMKTYRAVSHLVGEIQRKTRARSLFEASAFQQIYFAAGRAAGIPQSR
ncbi:MAG: hypothetical protein ABSG62_02610 [Terracidiphilus sp.]|jgi:hypothetical protein